MQKQPTTFRTHAFVVSLAGLPVLNPSKMSAKMIKDIPSLISDLRRKLLKLTNRTDEVDSNIVKDIQVITGEIKKIDTLEDQSNKIELLSAILYAYINDLMSIRNCLSVITSDHFLEIYKSWYQIESDIDYESHFKNKPQESRTQFDNRFKCLVIPVVAEFLQGRFPRELDEHFSSILCDLLPRIAETVSVTVFKKNALEAHRPTLRHMVEYLERNSDRIKESPIDSVIESILSFFWNLSDDTILVPDILQVDYHVLLLKWISNEAFSIDTIQGCLHTLHNIARHEKGVLRLTELNALSTFKNFKKSRLDPNKKDDSNTFVDLRLVYCMVVSLINERQESADDFDSLRPILDQLVDLAVKAGESENGRYEGFHSSEPLVVLAKLCLHDDILKYVFTRPVSSSTKTQSMVEYYASLLIQYRGALVGNDDRDQLALLALFNTFWSVSFHDEYTDFLRSNKELLKTVRSFSVDDTANVGQYVPKHMSPIWKAAGGILWNLDEDTPAQAARHTKASEVNVENDLVKSDHVKDDKIRVMISYSHANTDFCHQLVDALKTDKRLQLWVDFDNCHTEDLWGEIGEAIEQANVILFLMSKDYQNSKSCRQEVMYATDSLKKRFIPIFLQKEFVATGWLGVRIVGPQYIRFGKRPFDQTVSELIKLVFEDKTKTEKPKIPESQVPDINEPKKEPNEPKKELSTKPTDTNEQIVLPNKPVENWTRADIGQYLSSHSIDNDLINLYKFNNGRELILYRRCLEPNWQIEYDDIRTRYEKQYEKILYRDEFVRFVDVVSHLRLGSTREKQGKNQEKSTSCVIF